MSSITHQIRSGYRETAPLCIGFLRVSLTN